MKTNDKIFFPYYSGNIKFTKVMGHVSLSQFINSNKNPKKNTEKIINQIKISDELNLFKLKRKLKHKLFSFTPSVYVKKWDKRKYENIYSWTGLMQLDFDAIENIDIANDLKSYIYEQEETICSLISPSQKGVKAIISIKTPEDTNHYKAIFEAVKEKYESIFYFDEATKNPMLPLFLSADKDILYRDISECKPFSDEKWIKKEYVNLSNNNNATYYNSGSSLEDRTLRILKNKISSINSSGHPQVRSAALILGSRISAGYIDKITAENEIISLIQNNDYLKKGTQGYIETAMWGIAEGMKNPKYYA